MNTFRAYFGSALILLVTTLPAPARDGDAVKVGGDFAVETTADIAYYTGPDADANKHKLDLFVPKGAKDFPVFFFVHGGGWTSGDRKLYGGLGRLFAKNGVGTVIISYRLTPTVQHPGHIEDVARAFAWTHANIGKYGGRVDQIFISGHSAGGHLVALLAANERYLKAEKLTPKAIKGVIALSGVYIVAGNRMERIFGKGPDAADSASPLKHVSGKEPPFLIVYADQDFPGCDRMSEAFNKALTTNKIETKCLEVKERTHISIMVRLILNEADPATQAMLEFIAKHSDLKLMPKAVKGE